MRLETILTFIGLIAQIEKGPLVHGRNREENLVVVLTFIGLTKEAVEVGGLRRSYLL